MQTRPSILRHLEALLFSAGEPLSPEDILSILRESVAPELSLSLLDDALEELRQYLANEDCTFQLQLTGGGWQLLTKPAYYPTLSKYFKQQSGKRLSKAALETLSIVAYRQPVTRADVEAVRGVGSDYAINKLLERELITIIGRDQGPGRPLLYSTSPQFMDYFGLADISDLPKLRELIPTENSIGEMPDITEPTAMLQQKIDKANITINGDATETAASEIITAATSVAVVADLLGFEGEGPALEVSILEPEEDELREIALEAEDIQSTESTLEDQAPQRVADAPKPDLNEAWEEALAATIDEPTEVLAQAEEESPLKSEE